MGTAVLDSYSYLHFAVGIVLYYWDIDFILFLIGNILFEVGENSNIGMKLINKFPFWPGGKSHADSFQNSVSDVIFGVIGYVSAIFVKKYL